MRPLTPKHVLVRTRYGTSISIDPAAEGPMSVRELATLAATRLGQSPHLLWTLVRPGDGAWLDRDSTAPTTGTFDLVDEDVGV